MNRKPRDRRNRKKKFDPYLFGAERGPLGATPKGQMHKDLREMDQENMKAYEEYQRAPRFLEKGGAAFPDLTGDGKVTRADILKGRGVKGFKGGGAVMKGRGGYYKGCK
jgi:hypothetical protein